MTEDKKFFCCADGIYYESQTHEESSGNANGDGIDCRHITFVISKKKPSDGICKPIYRYSASSVSHPMREVYKTAAGDLSQAWYWLEYTE